MNLARPENFSQLRPRLSGPKAGVLTKRTTNFERRSWIALLRCQRAPHTGFGWGLARVPKQQPAQGGNDNAKHGKSCANKVSIACAAWLPTLQHQTNTARLAGALATYHEQLRPAYMRCRKRGLRDWEIKLLRQAWLHEQIPEELQTHD